MNSLSKSIIWACERVGRDRDGRFPFNASDLADRILKLESHLNTVEKALEVTKRFQEWAIGELLRERNYISEDLEVTRKCLFSEFLEDTRKEEIAKDLGAVTCKSCFYGRITDLEEERLEGRARAYKKLKGASDAERLEYINEQILRYENDK